MPPLWHHSPEDHPQSYRTISWKLGVLLFASTQWGFPAHSANGKKLPIRFACNSGEERMLELTHLVHFTLNKDQLKMPPVSFSGTITNARLIGRTRMEWRGICLIIKMHLHWKTFGVSCIYLDKMMACYLDKWWNEHCWTFLKGLSIPSSWITKSTSLSQENANQNFKNCNQINKWNQKMKFIQSIH